MGTRHVREKTMICPCGLGLSTSLIRQRTGHNRVLSTSTNRSGLEQSAVRHWQRTRTVRGQSTDSDCPRPRSGDVLDVSANRSCPESVRIEDLSCTFRVRFISWLMPESFPLMPSFDPATVRKAVAEFAPRCPQKFQDLLPAKDVMRNCDRGARRIAISLACSPKIVCQSATRPAPVFSQPSGWAGTER